VAKKQSTSMPKTFPDLDKPLTYSERAEVNFIPSGTPSLMESIRGCLPDDDDDPAQLVYLATRQQGLYMTMLGKLIAGSSFKAASQAIGITPSRIYDWLSKGQADLGDDIDSYCSRLLLDCQRAQAMSVSDAEERVHKNNPDKWLGKGSAKEFHKRQYWIDTVQRQGDDPNAATDAIDPLDPPPMRELVTDETVEDTGEQQLQEALRVLEEHNIINNPEFVKQAREQYRLPKAE
jgi:hypothetical protein